MERLLEPQPDLRRPHQGRRRADAEEAINRSCSGPDRPGQRRDARPAQGRAVPGLRGFRLRRLLRRGRRLLRPLPGPHGRDAREPEDRRARPSRTCRPGRSTWASTSGRSCPTKAQVFSTIEGLISHFELVMSNRGFEVPCEEVYSAIEAPNGELGFYIVGDGTATGLSRALPAAVVHPLRPVPAPDPRPHAQRRGGRAGESEHHRGGTGSVADAGRGWTQLEPPDNIRSQPPCPRPNDS